MAIKKKPQIVEKFNYTKLGDIVRQGVGNYFRAVSSGKSGTPDKTIKKVTKRSIKKEKNES